MKLKYVTLTGADQSVRPEQLLELSQKYPFVEWGILFSQSKAGIARYPNHDWILDLTKLNSGENKPMNLSAHLCGKWTERPLKGEITFLESSYSSAFQRIQLNLGSDRLKQAVKSEELAFASRNAQQTIILGGNYQNINIDPIFLPKNGMVSLFDSSGGRGIKTKEWLKPFEHAGMVHTTGYAGGLGPDNLEVELPRIAEASNEANFWIDMESSLRTKSNIEDRFDLEKCEKILKIAEAWVCQNTL